MRRVRTMWRGPSDAPRSDAILAAIVDDAKAVTESTQNYSALAHELAVLK